MFHIIKMSVYIPDSQTGNNATQQWVKSRFVTKSVLNTLSTQVGLNTSNISSLTTRMTTAEGNITTINNRVAANAVKIGNNSVASTNTISIGNSAGVSSGTNTINIGLNASSAADYAICIGGNAKSNVNNAIVLNGMGLNTLTAGNNSLYVDPIRDDTSNNNILCYNATTKEVNQNSTLYSGLDSRLTTNESNITTINNKFSSTSAKLGSGAGSVSNGSYTVAIGNNAGQTLQSSSSVAIGSGSAVTSQGTQSVAIGNNAGYTTQGSNAVAIGNSAGNTNQGNNSIMIGSLAGQTSSVANSICLNSSGVAVNPSAAGFHVAPIRNNNVSNANLLGYDLTTKEITYVNNTSLQLKSTYTMGNTGGGNIQVEANPQSGAAYIRANRPSSTSGECGFSWANGGTNQWLNYMASGSDTLSWYNPTGQTVMSLDINGKMTVKGIPADTTGTSIMVYDSTSKELRYNSTLYSGLDTRITSNLSSIATLQGNFDKTKAYAYVRFNGNPTLTITNSYNVSSVTRVSTGVYTVNFISGTFPNANYVPFISCNKSDGNNDGNMNCTVGNTTSVPTATSCPITTVVNTSLQALDTTLITLICFYNNPNL